MKKEIKKGALVKIVISLKTAHKLIPCRYFVPEKSFDISPLQNNDLVIALEDGIAGDINMLFENEIPTTKVLMNNEIGYVIFLIWDELIVSD